MPDIRPRWYVWARRAVLAVGAVVLLVGCLGLATLALDHVAVKPVECQVVSAAPYTRGSGFVTSTASVMVQTRDCGRILVTGGIDFSDLEASAKSFVPGTRYEFDMGLSSRTWGKYLNMIPTARSFHHA